MTSAASWRLIFGAFLFGLIVLPLGAWLFIAQSVDAALRDDAMKKAENWARHLTEAMPDLDQLVDGVPVTAEQLNVAETAKNLGGVFRWKLFDENGALRFDSNYTDELAAGRPLPPAAFEDEEGETEDHAGGEWPHAYAETGDGVNLPRFYAEAFDKLIVDGRQIGVIEAYVDETGVAARLRHSFVKVVASVVILTALAFLIPMLAFLWRTREHKAAQDALAHAAHHDGLTGLLNRDAFRIAIRQQVEAVSGTPGVFRVIFVDLDRFKDINDTRGHAAGDQMLREVAKRICDEVQPGSAVCRMGGDEFAILDPQPNGPVKDPTLARRVIASLSEPIEINGEPLLIGASIGVSEFPGDGRTAGDLLRAADFALYEAKALGRGQHCHYEPSMEARRAERISLEERLRKAIEEGSFELNYQPLFRTRDGSMSGYEALMRLTDDNGEPISPGVFIPVAEETEMIVPLGELALERACAAAAKWPGHLTVAVNLSPVQFRSGKLPDTVRDVLERTGLPASRLELEVTESVLMTNADEVALQFDALKETGVSLALDDFGTGYSSLSYLWRFPFDKLKIDRSFVNCLENGDLRSRRILQTVVALGEVLELGITAEGVETELQAEQISEMNIDSVQGFYYGRPEAIDDTNPGAPAPGVRVDDREEASAPDQPPAIAMSRKTSASI